MNLNNQNNLERKSEKDIKPAKGPILYNRQPAAPAAAARLHRVAGVQESPVLT